MGRTAVSNAAAARKPPRRTRRGVAPAHPKHVLKVRVYAARVAWLDGALRWTPDGRILFRIPAATGEGGSEEVAPTPQLLARTQYCLYRIAAHPFSARVALAAEPSEWLAARQANLAWVKRVAVLGERVCTPPSGADDLAALLPIEARHADDRNPPPFSPAALLAARGRSAVAALCAALREAGQDGPTADALLVALTLGAALRRAEEAGAAEQAPPAAVRDPVLRAALALGLRHGLPREHALLASLLAGATEPDVEPLAERFLATRAAAAGSPFALRPALLRRLRAVGVPFAYLVRLCEAVSKEAVPLEPLVRRRRHELPRPPHVESAEAAREAQGQRDAVVRSLDRLLRGFVRAAKGDPSVVTDFCRYVRWALGLIRPALLTPHLEVVLLRPLRACLGQHASARESLRMLGDHAATLWGDVPAPGGLLNRESGSVADRARASRGRRDYLEHRWHHWVLPAVELMHASGGAADLVLRLVGCVERGGLSEVVKAARHADGALTDLSTVRWLLRHLCDNGPAGKPRSGYDAWSLCRLAAGGAAARARWSALVNSLAGAPGIAKSGFLSAALRHCSQAERSRRGTAVRAALEHAPDLLRRARRLVPAGAAGAEDEDQFSDLFDLLLPFVLDRRGGHVTPRTVFDLVERDDVAALIAAHSYFPLHQIRTAANIAASLVHAEGTSEGEQRFAQVFVPTLLRLLRTDEDRYHSLEDGLTALKRLPTLRATLAPLFPAQTHRCLTLLSGLSAADHLGSDGSALAPLAALEASTDNDGLPYGQEERGVALSDDPDWSTLLALAPDTASLAADYWHARWLLGLPADVPPGALRAAEDPAAALTRELAWLEEKGDRRHPGVEKRIASLRGRVQDAGRLRARAAEEAHERMLTAAREAQMAAAEALLRDCYRARCEVLIAQHIGPGVDFDADLVNATLIATRIETNRKPLVRLLRARCAGGRGAARSLVAEHPKNREFLAGLEARGVNSGEWLAERPRLVRLPGSGVRVRLRLERDPLRVLQMGNPFGTCLAAEGCNAFSTVANACELNKRVLLATDAATGRILGRKLIGLAEDGGLLGFHTYVTLDSGPAADGLRAAVRRYLLDFASRCGLETADEGTVPTIFCEDWYDDGAVAWSEKEGAATDGVRASSDEQGAAGRG